MENSLNSSSPEPTVSGLKSVFKKPTNFHQAFEVSLNESVAVSQTNKSDVDLDATSSGTKKAVPFKKTRKSIQKRFNVTSDGSLLDSDSEQSVTYAKPQPAFSKKNKSLVDYFNVSYNETNVSSQQDASSKSVDESNSVYNKKNPFRKANETHKGILVGDESSTGDSSKENTQPGLVESQKWSASFDEEEADSTIFATKQNPFKKSAKQKNDSISQLNLSVTFRNKSAENKTTDDQNVTNNSRGDEDTDSSIVKSKLNPFRQISVQNSDSISVTNVRSTDDPDITNNSRVNEDTVSSIVKSKLNPFKQISVQNSNSISVTNVRSTESSKEDAVLGCSMETSKNIGLDQSISKLTNNTTYLEQSSINDDNLNNWMSDQSDEEVPPPRIPSLPANLSHTKEKPVSTPTAEVNPLSVWEQKLNEIVSNAERKTKSFKLKMNSNTPPRKNTFKKPELNGEKPPEDVNKYKPPKLVKPAPFVTKKLYEYIIKKLEPKYGIDTMLESENLVLTICDTVKKVTRRKTHQKKLIDQLKKEMAKAGLIETTVDFYEFVIKHLPYNFRVKVVPCLQPVTNVVYPPKDVLNPFDKIL